MLKFREDTPLRQEDYLAMAEENRKMAEELAGLKGASKIAPPRRPRYFVRHWPVPAAFLAVILISVGIVLVRFPGRRPDAPNPGRVTTCYFGASTNAFGDELPDEPWRVNWGLYKSPCEHCDSSLVRSAPNSKEWFHSRDEVWQFIQKWNLEPCR